MEKQQSIDALHRTRRAIIAGNIVKIVYDGKTISFSVTVLSGMQNSDAVHLKVSFYVNKVLAKAVVMR